MQDRRPTEEQIRFRAYDLYRRRGCQRGHDMDDWLQAEYELMKLPVQQIAKLQPPKSRWSKAVKPSLVSLVQAALVLGAKVLPHIRR